jgi:hypothetical protein
MAVIQFKWAFTEKNTHHAVVLKTSRKTDRNEPELDLYRGMRISRAEKGFKSIQKPSWL